MPEITQNTSFITYLDALRDKFRGKPLPNELADYLTSVIYPAVIPHNFRDAGEDVQLFSLMGQKICTGYQRIIYTDYGPFLELKKEGLQKDSLRQSSGTSDDAEKNIASYINYTSTDGTTSVRFQTRPMADLTGHPERLFQPLSYYVSVYSVSRGELIPEEEVDPEYLLPDHCHALVCQVVSCHGRYRDDISDKITEHWPFVKSEYEALCAEYDPISLLGQFQVLTTSEDGREGIINLFCDMTASGRRHAGVVYNALVSALYNICTQAPDLQVIIPSKIGCNSDESWSRLHRKLSCRLNGMNVRIVKVKNLTSHEQRTDGDGAQDTQGPEPVVDQDPKQADGTSAAPEACKANSFYSEERMRYIQERIGSDDQQVLEIFLGALEHWSMDQLETAASILKVLDASYQNHSDDSDRPENY